MQPIGRCAFSCSTLAGFGVGRFPVGVPAWCKTTRIAGKDAMQPIGRCAFSCSTLAGFGVGRVSVGVPAWCKTTRIAGQNAMQPIVGGALRRSTLAGLGVGGVSVGVKALSNGATHVDRSTTIQSSTCGTSSGPAKTVL